MQQQPLFPPMNNLSHPTPKTGTWARLNYVRRLRLLLIFWIAAWRNPALHQQIATLTECNLRLTASVEDLRARLDLALATSQRVVSDTSPPVSSKPRRKKWKISFHPFLLLNFPNPLRNPKKLRHSHPPRQPPSLRLHHNSYRGHGYWLWIFHHRLKEKRSE